MAKEAGEYIDEEPGSDSPKTWEEAMRIIQRAMVKMGCVKQQAYGKENISKFHLMGVVVRASDKLERVINIATHGVGGVDEKESVEDDLCDLMNYAIYGVMLTRGWWELPMAKDLHKDNFAEVADRHNRAVERAQAMIDEHRRNDD